MRKTILTILILSGSICFFSSCCVFKKGSWAPLPSCKNAEETAKRREEKQKAEAEKHKLENTKKQENERIKNYP